MFAHNPSLSPLGVLLMRRSLILPAAVILSVALAACGTTPTADVTPPTQGAITTPQVPDAGIILDQATSITLFSQPHPERPGFSDQQLYWKGADGQVRRSNVADGQNVRVMSAVMQPGTQRAFVMLGKSVDGFAQDSIVELDLGTDQVVRVVADLTAQGVVEAFENTMRLNGSQLEFRARPLFKDSLAEIQTVSVGVNGQIDVLSEQKEMDYQSFVDIKLNPAPELSAQANVAAYILQLYWPKTLSGHHYPGSARHDGRDIYSLDINRGDSTDDAGDVVRAAAAGTARVYQWDGSLGYGRNIIITHGTSGRTLYAHLNAFSVSDNTYVSAKQTVGTVGRTGLPTPTPTSPTYEHLHFTLYNASGAGVPIASAAYPMYVRVASSRTATPGACINYTQNMIDSYSEYHSC